MNIDDNAPFDVEWCEICRKHKSGCCDGCGDRFKSTDQIYRSQSHHFHPGSVKGVAGMIGITKGLCVDCYRLDFEATYHQPAPPLPDRGMDPSWFADRQEDARVDALLKLVNAVAKGEASAEDREQLEKYIIGPRRVR